ncbi:MAG: hypothetical protein ACRDFB_05820, partial [Rhabdochlamydiaceae bacterium]
MTAPFFSIVIILTDKNAYLLPFTLDSIVHEQDQASFEVIIMDGTRGAVLSNLPIDDVKVFKSQSSRMPTMMNQALKQTSGE